MNNRYAFKGKRKDNGQWIYGDLIIDQYGEYYIHPNANAFSVNEYNLAKCIQMIEVIPETVGQCTGLKDKDGKLIFKGDILQFKNDDGDNSLYVVYWSESQLAWQVQEITCYVKRGYYGVDELCEFRDYPVVGNIHDNPELLEVER